MPKQAKLLLTQGRSNLDSGRPNAAIKLLRKAKAMCEDDKELMAEIYLEMAKVCEYVSREHEASVFFVKALRASSKIHEEAIGWVNQIKMGSNKKFAKDLDKLVKVKEVRKKLAEREEQQKARKAAVKEQPSQVPKVETEARKQTPPALPMSAISGQHAILTLLGGVLLSIGVFLPIIEMGVFKLSYLDFCIDGEGEAVVEGLIAIAMAGGAIVITVSKEWEFSWIPGVGALAVVAYRYFDLYTVKRQMQMDAMSDSGGDFFSEFATGIGSLMAESISVGIGGIIIGIGGVLLLAATATCPNYKAKSRR
ncbi:hypothetical protein STSP2_01835 [Anaerohalosphaera lusitana]|uniref:Tetratricopeptide repeat protein n=1 Tax=Anaerohalosphaera lusitana TaxID=1936003 RepID=A0A1U9NMD6_9BACT|nr:hypothetical protein [Anaerohalosphaera lusitana]AQT68666.1 hypothetical protein STSP2_01835 [Anaerohalosphaera lusitana]